MYSSTNNIRVMKWKRMELVGHVARKGREEVPLGFWWGNMWERDYLEDPGFDGLIMLRRIFRKWDGGTWIGLIWLRIRTVAGHLWSW